MTSTTDTTVPSAQDSPEPAAAATGHHSGRPGPVATWSADPRPTATWSMRPPREAAPADVPSTTALVEARGTVDTYPEALRAWAWAHGACLGIEPVGPPEPTPIARVLRRLARRLHRGPGRTTAATTATPVAD